MTIKPGMRQRPAALLAAIGGAFASPIAGGLAGVLAPEARAQTQAPTHAAEGFPNKPIRLTVPYAPGGGTDIVMRAIAPGMGEALGQSVVVENKPGGGTILATDAVARSAPDGYNLLAVGAPIYLNTALGIKTPYDPLKDLVPVTLLVNNPGLLLVGPSVKAATVQELVALSKATAGGLSYASAGNGSFGHLAGETAEEPPGPVDAAHPLQRQRAGAGRPDGRPGAGGVGRDHPIGCAGQGGQGAGTGHPGARALAALARRADHGRGRLSGHGRGRHLRPDAARAQRRPEIVARIHAAMKKAVSDPGTRKRLDEMGYQVIANTPEQFAAYLRDQITTWTKIVKDNGIKPD